MPGRPSGGAKKEELLQLARHGASIAHRCAARNTCDIYAALAMFFGGSRIRLSSVMIGCEKRRISLGDLSIMKILLLAASLLLAVSTAAFAGQCQDDIEKIDAALASEQLDADSRAQLEDMRNQAVQLCGAGNEAEGLDVTAEAKAMLNIQ